MKNPFLPVLLTCAGLAAPLAPAVAQGPISPASPSYTAGNLFNRPASAPPPPPSGAAAARSPFDGLAGAYPTAAASYAYPSNEPIDPNHKLGRSDQLSYRVVEDREDKDVPLFVTDSGEVNVPLIGRVKAVGKSTSELSADIKAALEREYYYHATVMLGLNTVAPRVSPGKVSVSGAVRTVGLVELPATGQMTASQAIYQMGGPVDFSNLKRAKVIRKGGPKDGIPLNIKAVEAGELDKDVVLQPNDNVFVPTATWGVKF